MPAAHVFSRLRLSYARHLLCYWTVVALICPLSLCCRYRLRHGVRGHGGYCWQRPARPCHVPCATRGSPLALTCCHLCWHWRTAASATDAMAAEPTATLTARQCPGPAQLAPSPAFLLHVQSRKGLLQPRRTQPLSCVVSSQHAAVAWSPDKMYILSVVLVEAVAAVDD